MRVPPSTDPARRGAARGLLLGALALLLAVLGLFLVLSGGDAKRETGVGDLGALPSDEAPSELEGVAAEAPNLAPAGARQGAAAAVAGVRLPGDGKLSGRVLEVQSGAPVAGVRVELLALPPAAAEFAANLLRLGRASAELGERVLPVATAVSGADGGFAFEGVRAGGFYLEARGAMHVPDGARRVRVAPSGDGGPVDVYVRAGGAVAGTVRLPNGAPARGSVTLYQGATSFLDAARRADLVRIEAALERDGSFWIGGVPPGEGYDLTAVGEGTVLSHAIGLGVRAGETTQVELTTRLGGVVHGRVLGEDPEGGGLVPVAGALVGPVPRGLRDLAFVEAMLRRIGTRAGPDGGYRIEGVPAGEFDVAAIGDLHLPGHVGVLRLAEGGDLAAPDLVLESGPVVFGRVVDGAGEPIAGVDVRWNLAEFDGRNADFSFTPLLYQAQRYFEYPRTDAEGRFRAGPLPGDAPHSVNFWRPGFAWARERWDPATQSGEWVVTLRRGGAVEGIVMDLASGEPARTFTIDTPDRIDQEAGEPGAWNPFAGGQLFENTGGRFRIDAMRPGNRRLTLRSPGFATKSVEVVVTEGQVTRGVVVELDRGATLAGRVVDDAGNGVAGAQVVALDSRGRLDEADRARTNRGPVPFGDESDGFLRVAPTEIVAGVGLLSGGSATADRDGYFELLGVPGEGAKILAVQREFAPTETEPIAFEAGARVDGIEIVLSRGGGLEGRITDRYGRPVPGAIVIASTPPNVGGGSGTRLYQGSSDADGRYRVQPMRGGSYFLLVTRGDEQLSLTGFLGTLHFDLVNVPENEVIQFDIVDPSASAARVYGRVLDAGRPVEGGVLTAANFESENLLGVDFKLAQVRRDGTYEFAGLAPGDYQFSYQGGPGRGGQVRLSVEVPDRPEWPFDVQLPQGGVRGRVTDATTGAALANAEVELRPLGQGAGSGLLGSFLGTEARRLRERTDDEGTFEFRGLEGGDFELTARGPRWGAGAGGYAPAPPRALRIDEGRMQEGVDVALSPSLVLRGIVRDSVGAPVAGARVVAIARAGTPMGGDGARSDGEGRFEVRGLAPGTYDLVASASGFAEARALGADPAAAVDIEITLGLGGELRVQVFGADGRAAAGAIGRLESLAAEPNARAGRAQSALEGFFEGRGIANTEGWIDFGRLAPGTYAVNVSRGAASGRAERVEVREGDRVDLRLDLR